MKRDRLKRIPTAILWGLSGMALAQSPTATVSPSPTASPSRTPTPTRTPSPTAVLPAVFRAANGFDEIESEFLFMLGLGGPMVIRDGTWGTAGSALATSDGTGRLYWVSPTASASPTASPTASPSPTPSPTASASPTITPSPTSTWLFEFKHGSVNDVTDSGASYDAANDAATISGWMRVGTATDAGHTGDFSSGLTGAQRVAYDTSYGGGNLGLFNSSGAFNHLIAGGGANSEFNINQTDTDGLRWGGQVSTGLFSVNPDVDEVYVDGYFRMTQSAAVLEDTTDDATITTNDIEIGLSGGGASDLDTIDTSMTVQDGWLLWMHPAAGSEVTLTEVDSFVLYRPTILLDDPSDQAIFRYDADIDTGKWCLISFSDNDGGQMVEIFTADGTYTEPWWAEWIEVDCLGGGGGGGGGHSQAAGNHRGGGTGGGGGGRIQRGFHPSYITSPVTVTVGQGGPGGAGGTLASGSNGTAGTSSTFGAYLMGGGGGRGAAGVGSAGRSGGGGGGSLSVGDNGSNTTASGGYPGPATTAAIGTQGGQSLASNAAGGRSEWGGGAGEGRGASAAAASGGGTSSFGGAGGGVGASVTNGTPGTEYAGGAGGATGYNIYGAAGGGTAGTAAGGAGGNGTAQSMSLWGGFGGGGGGSDNDGVGGNGGDAGLYGSGGGGGGAGTTVGGDGGDGSDGWVIVITYGRH